MNIDKAIKLLRKNNHKITPRRKDILHYFSIEDGYRTAKDVLKHMKKTHKGISFDTVYRNLHLYDELNILETTELNAEKHFRMNCAKHHHHHFICNDCGKTKKINTCPMEDVEQNVLANYHIEGHKFEVYGLCPLCSAV